MKKSFTLISLITILALNSCVEKDEAYDPKLEVLGKWQIIEIGNWPDMHFYNDGVYWEFLADSVLQYYDIASGNPFTLHEKYWLNDTALWIRLPLYDTLTMDQSYNYYFFQDKLRLENNDNPPIYRSFLLLKIE